MTITYQKKILAESKLVKVTLTFQDIPALCGCPSFSAEYKIEYPEKSKEKT